MLSSLPDQKSYTRKWRTGSFSLLAGVARAWAQQAESEGAAYLVHGVVWWQAQ